MLRYGVMFDGPTGPTVTRLRVESDADARLDAFEEVREHWVDAKSAVLAYLRYTLREGRKQVAGLTGPVRKRHLRWLASVAGDLELWLHVYSLSEYAGPIVRPEYADSVHLN